ncbi:MAG: class I SAM-dependent methyltransferase [Candidatus Heimdallarchaeaceae archaeon]
MLYKLYTIFYDKLNEFQPYVELYQDIASDIKGQIILDAGVGTGNSFTYIKKKEIFGLDLDKTRLFKAKEKKNNFHSLVCCDIEKIPHLDNSFDTILCINTLNFVKNDVKIIKELSRVTKKRGRIIIHVAKRDYNVLDLVKRGIKEIGFRKFLTKIHVVLIISLANVKLFKTIHRYSSYEIINKLMDNNFNILKIKDDSYLNSGIYCVAEKSK